MGRISFWSKVIGGFLMLISLAFMTSTLIEAQTQAAIRLELDKNRVAPGEPVNITLANLKIGTTYTLAIASTDGETIYHNIAIPVQKDSNTGTCRIPTPGDTFEEGDNGWCTLGLDAFTYNVKINTTGYNCRQNGGDGRCQVRLLVSGKNVVSPQYLTVGSGAPTPTKTSSGKTEPIISFQPKEPLLGQKVVVTINAIPTKDATYQISVAGKSITLNVKSGQCNIVGGNDQPPWHNLEHYTRAVGAATIQSDCTSTGGQLSYTADIYTTELGYTPPELPSYDYTVSFAGNGYNKSGIFKVRNEMHIELSAPQQRGKQSDKNTISVDEETPITVKAIGCYKGPVTFEYWGENAGIACSRGESCGYEPTTKNIVTTDEGTVTATDTYTPRLQNFGTTTGSTGRNLDIDGDGKAILGIRATCPAQKIAKDKDMVATGVINLFRQGIITLSMDKTIIDNYDKGIQGLDVIPILDKYKIITFSANGLRNGESSPGTDGLDRTNCFYVELFRGGVRLKRPANYPFIGDKTCSRGDGVLSQTIVIDRPDYAFHIFNGADDVFTDVTLCDGTFCSTQLNPSGYINKGEQVNPVLPDGEYELRLYEANGIAQSLSCDATPDAPACGNIEDSLVTSTTFQVGSAFHSASSPPCKVALIQIPNEDGTFAQKRVEFDSITEFNSYFSKNPTHIVDRCLEVDTALGGFATDPAGFVTRLLGFLLSISGAIALILIIRAGYQVMTSRGDPEKLGEARERLTSAIVGLLFIIFSLVILEVIGVDILRIPGFCRSGDANCTNQGAAIDPNVTPPAQKP